MTYIDTVATDVDIETAARRLYHAEVALHDAHASGVDAWITAASDRLHQAVVEHLRLAAADR